MSVNPIQTFTIVCSWDPIMAEFMDKFLRFKTRKWRRQIVFFRHCHRWAGGATVVVMSETANINIIFASSQRWDFHHFIWILQERVVVALLRRLHRSRWGNLYLCFFSLLTVAFLALWFVIFLTFFKASTNYRFFHYVTYGIFAHWFSLNQMFVIKFSVSFATAIEKTRPSHVFLNSLRSKRFQLIYCAKARAGAKKKWKGEGVGRKGNACPQTPRFWKTPLEISRFVSFVNWQLVNTIDNEQITVLKNLLSSPKHAPRDCKTVIKRSFTIKEGWNSKRLLRNFLFFIVKWNFESSVAFSQLKSCQNVAKKLFVRNNSLRRLWVLQSDCSP